MQRPALDSGYGDDHGGVQVIAHCRISSTVGISRMNTIDLQGRYAIVTGGTSGIGRAISQRLISSGAHLAVWDIEPEVAGLEAPAGNALPIKVDVSDYNSVEDALRLTMETFPRIDILVNNAGITGPNATLWDYDIADWDAVMRTNLNGVFYCSKCVVPIMRRQGYGRIVNMASVAGKEGNPNASAYSCSKAAVIAMTKSLGKELVANNIRVNCVTPAAVKTPLFSQMTKQHIEYMLSKIPLGRFGEATEIAAMVAWLCSDECSFSTGATFDASGGRTTF